MWLCVFGALLVTCHSEPDKDDYEVGEISAGIFHWNILRLGAIKQNYD